MVGGHARQPPLRGKAARRGWVRDLKSEGLLGGDLELVLLEQAATNQCLVDPFGNADDVELRKPFRGLDGETETHGLEARAKGEVVFRVSRPGILEPFFLEDAEGLVEAVERVDRRGVVIRAFLAAAPLAHHQVGVHEPALDRSLAFVNGLDRAARS